MVAQFAPFTKKPKTSLKPCPTNSLYSSEENTYLNDTLDASGVKLNVSTAASWLACPTGSSAFRSLSPTWPLFVVASSRLFGPGTLAMAPVLRTTP